MYDYNVTNMAEFYLNKLNILETEMSDVLAQIAIMDENKPIYQRKFSCCEFGCAPVTGGGLSGGCTDLIDGLKNGLG